MTDHINVFTYGTLRRNGPANHVLRRLRAEFVGEGETVDAFFFDHGGYGCFPRVLRDAPDGGHTARVAGEVWAVPADLIRYLDGFEGYAYRREAVAVELADGRVIDAEAYFGVVGYDDTWEEDDEEE